MSKIIVPDRKKVDFNEYAENYQNLLEEDLRFFGEQDGYFAEYKVKIVKETLSQKPNSILEYGCGVGLNLKYFKKHFPDSKLSACDISDKSIEIAAKKNNGVDFFIINDKTLDSKHKNFDLIFVACVFHHISPGLRKDSINKIKNLLTPGGMLYIFEHNPFNPITKKIVRDCVWDKDAILLKSSETEKLIKNAGLKILDKKFTLFFPSQLSFLRPLEKVLANIPLGGQYYVKAVKS